MVRLKELQLNQPIPVTYDISSGRLVLIWKDLTIREFLFNVLTIKLYFGHMNNISEEEFKQLVMIQ